MKGKKTTVMIHVDALRHDYVTPEDMPFLHSLAETGISSDLIAPFGFEPDGAYLTGREPEDYEGGVHFVYSPETSPYGFLRHFPSFMDKLGPYISFGFRRYFVEKLIRKFAPTARQRKQTYVGRIPFNQLPKFDLCEQEYAYEKGALNGLTTIYDLLRGAGKKWFFHGAPQYPVRIDPVVERACSEIDGSFDFIFLFIADLDVVGHEYGADSPERRTCARKVDEGLKKMHEHICSKYVTVDFLAFGDHGMIDVKAGVDVKAQLKKNPFKPGRDYTVFLDSTFARFWFHNEAARKPIEDLLNTLEGGSVISEQERDKYSIHWKTRKFGDLIWWVDEGYVVHPDYWHFRGMKKGMHGYRWEVKDNHAAVVFHSTEKRFGGKLTHSVPMVDMFATVVDSLGLVMPTGAKGTKLEDYTNADA
ncbi:alkaline phosphatase family protein [Pontiellaceae bacterium B12227]|nr:alkaline phosphatase family protein [Pontiellaceae bacterium B12227]